MDNTDERRALDLVYAATTPRELDAAYAAWAASYDRETAQMGYCLPFLVTAWVARHVPVEAGPVLDAGCGTGLSGPAMRALGYGAIEGLDMSAEMLAIAESRACYTALKQARLGDRLPWGDDHFAAFFCTGVFTQGHAPASGLVELARITRPGGHAVFTVRDTILKEGGFDAVFAELEQAGRWTPVERSGPFRAFAIDEPEVTVIAFVYRITG